MSKFTQGQVVELKSDKGITGAIIGVMEGKPENRYQVFTTAGLQTYYESQLESMETQNDLEEVDAERFHAGLTASLIRNPSLSSLYSLNTAQIDFIPHQFRPVLKFIRSDRPRLLIADGVGVGKTIEAGLIMRELQARRNLDSVLIICPRPLVTEQKWEKEMKLRFGEEFMPIDGKTFRHCINEMDLEGEWPEKYKKAIIPYSLFDEANVFGNKKHHGLMEIDPPKFDLVIVDEAHHIRNTATYGYRAVSRFCDAAEAVVLLTATPVQLQDDDLFVLLNLLRPDLVIDRKTFYDMSEPNAYINMASTYVRGFKEGWKKAAHDQILKAIGTSWGQKVFLGNPTVQSICYLLQQDEISIEQRVQLIADIENMHTFSNIISRTRRRDIGEFTIRKPYTVTVDFTLEQKELHDSILRIIHEILSTIHCTDNTKFMMTTIRRQTASCLFGLVPMLRSILYRHIDEIMDSEESYDITFNGIDKYSDSINGRIDKIIKLAEQLPKDDPKFEALMTIINKKSAEDKNKIMIFSSFKHTLHYLYQKLAQNGFRVGMIHGGVPDEDRRDLRKRFDPMETPKDDDSALDILLFSEVGCEGLDYQFCDCMINYDLPWNPMKVEQRIGRIDRNGQTSESVAIYNMVTPGTVDADIYERCLMRIGVFHSSIGDCEDILGEVTSELRKIVDNFELTDEERREKMQQMTDNKIRFVKEQQELEEKQRDLFGIHVPRAAFDTELKNATNYWLASENIQNLVMCYLKERLEADKEYILGAKELKKLRLSQEARLELLDDFKRSKMPRTEINRSWRKWLESGKQILDITFESKCWRENPKATLLSVTHPLVKMAAEYLQSKGKVATVLKVRTNSFASGEYPFAIYQWKLSGEKEDLQMVPVSANSNLNRMLFELLKQSYGINYQMEVKESGWEAVESTHHGMWNNALRDHKEKTEELISYKEASLRTSHAARMASLEDQLKNSNNKNYVQMTSGKIRIAQEDYEVHMAELQNAKTRADILFELLAYGLLVIEPEEIKEANQSLVDTMNYIVDQYGKESIQAPLQVLGLVADFAPEHENERRKLRLLYNIGAFDLLNEKGLYAVDEVVDIAQQKLGYEPEETNKLLKYIEVFYK